MIAARKSVSIASAPAAAKGVDHAAATASPAAQQHAAPDPGGPATAVVFENTYIVGPEGHGQVRIQEHRVREVVKRILAERLAGLSYDPVAGTELVQRLSAEVRDAVAALGFPRYKLIVSVQLAERRGQDARCTSRCLWDAEADGHVSEAYQGETLLCSCQVYGLYFE